MQIFYFTVFDWLIVAVTSKQCSKKYSDNENILKFLKAFLWQIFYEERKILNTFVRPQK